MNHIKHHWKDSGTRFARIIAFTFCLTLATIFSPAHYLSKVTWWLLNLDLQGVKGDMQSCPDTKHVNKTVEHVLWTCQNWRIWSCNTCETGVSVGFKTKCWATCRRGSFSCCTHLPPTATTSFLLTAGLILLHKHNHILALCVGCEYINKQPVAAFLCCKDSARHTANVLHKA